MAKAKDIEARKARAENLDRQVRGLVKDAEKTIFNVARLCSQCRREKLHKELGFPRFEAWLIARVGRRKSTIYLAMTAVEELDGQISDEQLHGLTLENAATLARVQPSRRLGLLEKAKNETAMAFRRTANNAAGGQVVEEAGEVLKEFWLEPSMAEATEHAIRTAMILEDTESRPKAFERIISEFLVSHPDPELERHLILEAEHGAPRLSPEELAHAGPAIIKEDGGLSVSVAFRRPAPVRED